MQPVGPWTLDERLGRGGNAEVHRATDASGREVALKVIHRRKARGEPYERFVREIGVLRALGETEGVLPLIDAHVPVEVSRQDRPWLAMPIAMPIRNALDDQPLETVVEAVARIATTLVRLLSDHGIAHRDIKPGNLYRHDNDWVVGDFGLIALPDVEGLTAKGRALGPVHYVPFEMLRDASSADPWQADVYALAKTLWVLTTGLNYPPPGHQPSHVRGQSISDFRYHPMNGPLDQLIDRATRPDPEERPTMREVADELASWLRLPIDQPSVDVADARRSLRAKLDPELARQDMAEERKEHALVAVRRLAVLFAPINQALAELHPRATIDGEPDKSTRNLLRTHEHQGSARIDFRYQRLSSIEVGSAGRELVLRVARSVELSDDGDLLLWLHIDVGNPRYLGPRAFDWRPRPWTAPVGSIDVERILQEAVREAARQLEKAAAVFAEGSLDSG